ncbi:winged helix-turn-helix transcriptional regulator [Methanococcoides seepicolus]|uniref:Winged helix-turn-helix transcriptional regulator n=1 Tax=Methanococcoides seepicolus TaxID=2828780 RepID=A0A9E5DA88_9EURY|nr:winged helix-turn-helix transcriptional regulator [Methanococcoides seepicolus]MCM1985961.1 winged helix-turn-helix transcriptional regulator [Methanococcoides seepicolus]
MKLNDTDQTRIKKIAQTLSEVSNLNETDMFILLTLMKNSKITNSELAKILDFKDGNSAAYHTRNMQKEGLIDRYTIVPNWKRAGLATEFIILAEAEDEEQLLEIEKEHVIMADEYSSTTGEIVVTPTISGCVILQNVYHCFGDKTMAVISGRATSDQDAAVYCKNYLVNRYPDIKISMLLNKYKTVDEFFIDMNAVTKLKELFQIPEKEETSDTLEKLQGLSSEY